jgi:hypothetical protein
MNTDKILNVLLWVVTGVSLVLAAISAVFAFNTSTVFTMVILLLVAVLFLALTGLIGYLAYMDTFKVSPSAYGSAKKPLNYFLNANGKRNGIALDDLTFEIIDKQMNNFIMDAFGSPIALWKNSVFSGEQEVFGKDGAFKVLLAYKMISDLQAHHSKKVWKMFFELPDVDFADLQECFVVNGDDELAKTLNMYRLTGESCVAEAAAYLDENASYIQRRMLNYVTRKINSFDM